MKNGYGYIYKTINNINGKWYIGSKRCEKETTEQEAINDRYLGSGLKIKKAISKYGRHNFTKLILCFCDDAYEFEELLLSVMGAATDRQCYNVTNQGCGWAIGHKYGTYVRTKSHRLKLSVNNGSRKESVKIILREKAKIRSSNPEYIAKLKEALARPEVVLKMSIRGLNQIQSKETKEKRRNSINNIKHKWSCPVIQYTSDDVFIQEFPSIAEAAKSLGKIDRKGIGRVCQHKQKLAYGFKWEYK